MSSSRHLAAILFTDIVDYTAMMQKDEALALTAVRRHNSVVADCVKAHRGQVVNDYGDGCLSTFQSATEAVQCAIDIQNELRKAPSVPVRIGLHLGEVYTEGGKVMGDGVNVASRVQSLGTGNSILLSSALHNNISNHPEFTVVSAGTFHFKNVNQPMEVFALTNEGLNVPKKAEMHGKLKEEKKKSPWLVAGLAMMVLVIGVWITVNYVTRKHEEVAAKEKESIAVLYFDNMSGDPSQEYFSDGMTEEIISKLSMIQGLRVTSRTSVWPYKEKKKSVREIGKDLGVKSILEGSVRKSGDKVRITAQLINTETDEHFWAESFESEIKDVLQLQSEIAQGIARKFRIEISQKTHDRLFKQSRANPKAYDLYLQALNSQLVNVNVGTEQPQAAKDISKLKEAIRLSPAFSQAYALLGSRYLHLSQNEVTDTEFNLIIDSARLTTEKGIQLDPDNSEGYLTLAAIHAVLGKSAEALKWAIKAHELDPYVGTLFIRDLYLSSRQYDKVATFLKEEIKLDPGNWLNYFLKARLFQNLGLSDSANHNMNTAMSLAPPSVEVAKSAYGYYRLSGQMDEILRLWPTISSSVDEKSANYSLGGAYFLKRDWSKADSLYRNSSASDDLDAACIALHQGREEEGRKYLQNVIQRRSNYKGRSYWDQFFQQLNMHYWVTWDLAAAHAMLGDKQFVIFGKQASDEGWHSLAWLEMLPYFDPIRQTPEFKELERYILDRNEIYKRQVLKVFSGK